jgi:hypothetical protein
MGGCLDCAAVSGRCDLDVSQLDSCTATDGVGYLRDLVDVGDELLELFMGGIAGDLDVV